MKRLRYGVLASVLTLTLGAASPAYSQCAMCRKTVESAGAQQGNNELAQGMNTGILYLLSAPYIVAAAFGFWWYREKKKHNRAKNSES